MNPSLLEEDVSFQTLLTALASTARQAQAQMDAVTDETALRQRVVRLEVELRAETTRVRRWSGEIGVRVVNALYMATQQRAESRMGRIELVVTGHPVCPSEDR